MRRRVWMMVWAVFMLMGQGLSFVTPCRALALPAQTAEIHANRLESHTQYCRCAQCAGEKSCCCRPTNNPIAAVIITSACETKPDASTISLMVFRVLPSVSRVVATSINAEIERFAPTNEAASSRTPQPQTPPPCLA